MHRAVLQNLAQALLARTQAGFQEDHSTCRQPEKLDHSTACQDPLWKFSRFPPRFALYDRSQCLEELASMTSFTIPCSAASRMLFSFSSLVGPRSYRASFSLIVHFCFSKFATIVLLISLNF